MVVPWPIRLFCSASWTLEITRGGTGSDRILRFSFGPVSVTGVKNLWKTGPGPGVTCHFGSRRSLCGHFLKKHECITVVSIIATGVWTGVGFSNLKYCRICTGPGFINFGTGAESESEKVILATSGNYLIYFVKCLERTVCFAVEWIIVVLLWGYFS